MTPHTKKMVDKVNAALTGAVVTSVGFLDAKSCENLGWDQGGFALTLKLKNGQEIAIFASQDDEGNGPGALFTTHPDFETLWVDAP